MPSDLDKEHARILKNVRTFLDSIRRNKEISQTDLARLAEMTQPMLSEFFSGYRAESSIKISTLLRLADALGLRLVIAFEPKETKEE